MHPTEQGWALIFVDARITIIRSQKQSRQMDWGSNGQGRPRAKRRGSRTPLGIAISKSKCFLQLKHYVPFCSIWSQFYGFDENNRRFWNYCNEAWQASIAPRRGGGRGRHFCFPLTHSVRHGQLWRSIFLSGLESAVSFWSIILTNLTINN